MGSGSSWGMIIGFVIGAAFVMMGPAGVAMWSTAMWTGAAIGGAIGGLAGGIIDPMEFPTHHSEGQKIEEINIMGVQEGEGIVASYGSQIRVAGQLIACSGVHETKHTSQNPTGGGGKKSFLKGTPIRMADGTDKAIEKIMPGDIVRTARFSKTRKGKLCFRDKEVTKRWASTTEKALRVVGEGFDFTCTPEHEVYGLKPDHEAHWFQAHSLRSGDKLLSEKGWVTVDSIDRFEIKAPTYNLTVKDDENYFADGVLVHNKKDSNTTNQGGTTTWYTYDCDFVTALCEGPINYVSEVYFNGKKKYRTSVDYPVTREGSLISFTVDFGAEWTGPTSGVNSPDYDSWLHKMKITANGGSGHFSDYLAGQYCTMTGGGSPWDCNHGSHKILSVGSDYIVVKVSATVTSSGEHYVHTLTNHGGESWTQSTYPGNMSNTWNPLPSSWGATGYNENTSGAKITASTNTHDTTLVKEFRFYIGDDGDYDNANYGSGEVTVKDHYNNNTADQILTDVRNPSPKYKGIAYCAIEEMQLADFGNQIPQCNFTVQSIPRENEILTGNPPTQDYATVGQVIDSILIGRGFKKEEGVGGDYTSGDSFNTDVLQTVTEANRVRGYTAKGAKTSQQLINTLVLYFDLMLNERQGVLVFTNRETTTTKTLLPPDLGSYADPEGKDNIPLFTLSDKESSDLPNEINVSYYDINDNYQKGSQKARLPVAGINRAKMIEIPMGLKASEAQTVGNRLLYKSHEQRQRCKLNIAPSFIDIEAGDLISVTAGTDEFETYNVRVLELNRGADYTHEITGLIEGSGTSDYTGDADEDQVVDVPYSPPPMKTLVFDSPALHTGGINAQGHYIMSCTENEDQEFTSAKIWRKIGGSGTFTEIASIQSESMLVRTDSVIPDGPVGVWDEKAEILVTILGPVSTNSPATETEPNVFAFSNLLYVNGELISFKTAEVVGDGRQYRLTNLIRGRRGTSDRTGSHTESGYTAGIVSYDEGGAVSNIEYQQDDFGVSIYYKVVASGAEVSDATQTYAQASNTRLRPFPVGGVRGYEIPTGATGAGDWIIDFARTDRAVFKLFSQAPNPDTDGIDEEYRCNIYKADGDTLLTTLSSAADTTNGSGIAITQYNSDGTISEFPRVTYKKLDIDTDNGGAYGSASIHIEIQKIGLHMSGIDKLVEITDERLY